MAKDTLRQGEKFCGMEYSETFKRDGTEIEIKMKTDCHTQDELNEAISFMARSSRKFYLHAAEKISSML